MKQLCSLFVSLFLFQPLAAQQPVPQKPRVLISTDIGGTDPDDNQSMAHLLMMNERFDIEGLVSSPSFGQGSKEEIERMIDLYSHDYAVLKSHVPDLLPPDSLRTLCKQGRRGAAAWEGYAESTEGSRWIVDCARRGDARPLWVLVWGALEDLAQALHDAPDIAPRLRVYWIGGPNKKWGCNAYTYIAAHFPDLWMIENNASYRGFIGDVKKAGEWQNGYYEAHIRGAGHLGADFIHYYEGNVKMGDTPSLLYMMDGDPENPARRNWGGEFERLTFSPYRVTNGVTTLCDTLPVYSVWELRLPLPKKYRGKRAPEVPFILHIDKQDWEATACGDYAAVRYAPKAKATLHYSIRSEIKELNGLEGDIVVSRQWPGDKLCDTDLKLGAHWYTDVQAPDCFSDDWQGYQTVARWREEVLRDWAVRWNWLKNPGSSLVP
jgi:hypothetical protein